MRHVRITLIIFLGVITSMSAQKVIISTDKAPKAIGPYSQAVVSGNMLFVSGQIPIDPQTGAFVEGAVKEQTEQVFKNLEAIITASDFAIADVVSCTVYLKSMNDFAAMNEVYAKHFATDYPSRATVEVARLPKDALVEISCIAVKGK